LRERCVDDARRYVELAERVNGPIPRPVDWRWAWGDARAILDDLGMATASLRYLVVQELDRRVFQRLLHQVADCLRGWRAADGPCVCGDETARRRGLSSRRSPSLSSLTTTLPVMAQIDIEYAGRTYTVPWTDDNVERLKGIAQHVRDGRAEVFTVLGDGFALTIVVGPTIPLAITYVD
jgi:hypothetical protein